MFPKTSLTTLLLLAMSVAATPVVNIRENLISHPFAKRVNVTGTGHIVQQDRARVQQLIAKTKATSEFEVDATVASTPVTNQAVSYIASVGVGKCHIVFEHSGLVAEAGLP